MQRNEGRISSLLISFLLACSFLLPGVALAQTQTTGSITGRLTDIGGAVIAGGSVNLTSRATGAQTTATTDQTGNYRFNLLPPGAYALRQNRCTGRHHGHGYRNEHSQSGAVAGPAAGNDSGARHCRGSAN